MREYYRGEIDVPFVQASMRRLSLDPDFSPDFDTIVDLRESLLKMSPPELTNLMATHFEIFGMGYGRTAFLVDQPKAAALTSLFGMKMLHDRHMKIFSTIEAAEEWLGHRSPSN